MVETCRDERVGAAAKGLLVGPRTPLRGRGGAGKRLRVGRVVSLGAHRGETPLWLSGMAQRGGRGRPPRERSWAADARGHFAARPLGAEGRRRV